MNIINYTKILVVFLMLPIVGVAQSFQFAFVTDTHIGNPTAAEDLRRTVQDINANQNLAFVVLTGDITEFGSDEELILAKQILDSLNKPYHIISGNHDSNWSESGSNSFRTVFGRETFAFMHGGYLFTGTSSGPNMRMGPGQVPRENIVQLDSVLTHLPDPNTPVIYLNHYPQTADQNNWYEALDRLKKRNVQLLLCGHGHNNRNTIFEGIPSIMGRSNLRAKESEGGYNIVTFKDGVAIFEERRSVAQTLKKWAEVPLVNHYFAKDTVTYTRPSYTVNSQYPQVKKVWEFQDKSDVGAGTTTFKDLIIATNTNGVIYALNEKDGKPKWSFQTNGKIYSTPAVANGYVVMGSSDKYICCLNADNGKLIWKTAALKPVVASPVIKNKIAYIGGSDGHFRALSLKDGKVIWDFDQVKGFVVTRPLLHNGKIYFGCWENEFYALDAKTGKLVWKWNNGSTNRMFSPAAVYPVAAHGRIFIVAPDRYMTAFDAATGKVIWRKQMEGTRVRESMGLSADKALVYVKTMDGQLLGISTKANDMQIAWESALQLPYELDPAAIIENKGVILVPTHAGLACAVDRKSGKVLWQYKISNCLLNPIMPINKNTVLVSAMDGKLTCLEY